MDTISVQGLLDNRKTQTRRVMRNAPGGDPRDDGYDSSILARCPFGQPGDRLWMRETWRVGAWHLEKQAVAVDYLAGPTYRQEWLHVPDAGMFARLVRQSLEDAARAVMATDGPLKWDVGQGPTRWRPSMFMPRWASRALLELVEVRFQPVQAIGFDDCLAEGIISTPFWGGDVDWEAIRADQARPMHVPADGEPEGDEINQGWMDYARGVFIKRWDSINAGRGHAWASSPWVWAVSFQVLEIKARPRLSFYVEEIALDQTQGGRA